MLAQPQVFVQQAIDTLLHVHELVTGQQQRPGGHRREGELPTSLSEGYGRASFHDTIDAHAQRLEHPRP